eukprot:PITA_34155
MLYGYPSAHEASRLKSLLNDFSEASGTHVNNSKSQIFFFHTPPPVKSAVSRILGFQSASLPSIYLGAPLTASAIKQPAWRSLLEKLESKLNLWTHRSLNLASRVVLIKSIFQAMPLYIFSILAAPKWVLKRLRNLQCDFLWGSSTTNRKWALVKWDTEQQHATVHQFWELEAVDGFRKWRPSNQIPSITSHQEVAALEDELKKRSIRLENSEDILRWGYLPKGSYTTSESYNLIGNFSTKPDPLWGRIWSFKAWPKISHFLWMVGHRNILTWDKLRRRNFHGPSICHNCIKNEETLQHLLDTCPIANQI